jgi:hypothetical protein
LLEHHLDVAGYYLQLVQIILRNLWIHRLGAVRNGELLWGGRSVTFVEQFTEAKVRWKSAPKMTG